MTLMDSRYPDDTTPKAVRVVGSERWDEIEESPGGHLLTCPSCSVYLELSTEFQMCRHCKGQRCEKCQPDRFEGA